MFTTAFGVNTQYQQIGKGTPLILLHGWGCTWETWYPIIQALSDHFQLIIPDLPAFGESDNPDIPWNTELYVEWLKDFLDQTVGDKKYHLAGHSYGGKIAAMFTGKYQPTHLKKLIIIDASGLPDELPASKQLQQKLLGFVPAKLKTAIPTSIKLKIATTSGSSDDYVVATKYQKEVLKRILREDITEYLKTISTKTLIVWGRSDDATPFHQGQKFNELITSSQLVTFQTGHYPFVEQPNEFIEEVKDFLS